MTIEVAGIVMFWQISYGLSARVHVTPCPGAGIGGRLQVPVGGARRDLESCIVAAKVVNDARSNTNAAIKILRVKRCVNAVVFLMFGFLLKTLCGSDINYE